METGAVCGPVNPQHFTCDKLPKIGQAACPEASLSSPLLAQTRPASHRSGRSTFSSTMQCETKHNEHQLCHFAPTEPFHCPLSFSTTHTAMGTSHRALTAVLWVQPLQHPPKISHKGTWLHFHTFISFIFSLLRLREKSNKDRSIQHTRSTSCQPHTW